MIPFVACGDAAVAVVWLPVEKKAAEPPFDEAFAEAVKTAEAPKEREKYSRFDSCSLTPYARAGMDLATRYPAIDLQKLQKAIAGKKNTPAGRLAWVVLANLADREDARNVILCRAIEGDKTAILAISFMPPVAREDTAAEVVVRCGNTGGMADAIELLGCIGDNGTVEFLEVAAKIPNEDVSLAAARALDCLKEKLRQAPTVQQVWTMYELRYWRTVREIAGADLGDADYDRVVEWLHEKNAKYPVQFLRCRINTGDPLAILLAGLQREKSLIDDLSAAAEAGNSRNRDMAFVSLARIGRWDAMAVLADQMKPDALEDNRNVAKVLASYGTDAAVELLKRLADDENYSRSKPVFEEAVKYLKQRLECESSGFFITGRLFVAGNDVVQSCQEEMLELFVKKTPGITAEYLFGGDWRGIRELADGNVDVAIVSGEGLLLQSEENAFAKAFPATAEQPRSILAGCIGVAFIVHKDNPVKSLGYEQVKDIYLGKIQDWSEVSGGKGKIRVCGMRPWKVAGYCLNAHVGGMKTKVEWREDMEWVNSSDEAMEMVAANPDMIGFISYNGKYPDLGEAKTVGIVKNESAVLPTRESIATMEYPFVYSVRFIVRPGASKLATDYVRFALNDKDAVRIWGLDGFVPASYGEKVRADARLREMQAGKGERVLAAGCAGIKEALADLAVEYARASRPVQLSCAEADSAAAAVAKFVDGGADKCELLVLAGRPDADALKACGGKWNSLGPDGAGPAECIALGRAAAIVVNSANELDALTPDQLRGIFAGYISDWAAVGGKKNLRINRLGLQPGGPAADIFESCCLPAREWFKVAAAKDTGEILKIAGGDPCAIAFVDLAAMPAETQNIKVLGIRIGAGENMKVVMPTPENIRMEAYPLSQRLYLYIHPKAGEAARDFAKFVATSGGSEAGPYADTAGAVKDACGRHGLVPLGGDETRQ